MQLLTFDPSTFLFCTALFAFLMAQLSFSSAKTLPKLIEGLSDWGFAMLAVAVSFSMNYVRGKAPDLIGVLLPNVILVLMPVFGLRAYTRFYGVKDRTPIAGALAAAGMLSCIICFWMNAPRAMQAASVSLPFGIIVGMISLTILKHGNWRESPVTASSGVITGLLGLVMFGRGLAALFGPAQQTDLTNPSAFQLVVLMVASACVISVSMGFVLMAQERARKDILESSRRDGLTGLYSRSAFFDLIQQIELRSSTEPCAVVMVDIDFFKKINDTYGHGGGDIALVHAARMISSCIRSADLAGRYGGEEFCLLLRNCGPEDAKLFVNRLIQSARTQRVRLPGGKDITFTLSAGYAVMENPSALPQAKDLAATPTGVPPPIIKEHMERADQALYEAKRNGRDQAVQAV